jgi:hypothetical protein
MNRINSGTHHTVAHTTLGNSPVRISSHAIDRYRDRVDLKADRRSAFAAIGAMLAAGTVRTTPHWWTTCRLEPDTRLVYSAVNPDVCLIIKNGTVVTLVTRALCAPSRSVTPARRLGIRSDPYARSNRVFEDDGADIYEPLPEELAWVA